MPVSHRTVLLDANLLLLLVIGTVDRGLIQAFKRTSQFTIRDFEMLLSVVHDADAVFTTPHLLAEVSNLANALRDDQKQSFANHFGEVIASLTEQYTQALVLSQHELFRFGIADVSMLQTDAKLILTEDGRFAAQVNEHGNALALDLKTAIHLFGRIR